MKYLSTRGKAPLLAFDDVLLAGLADDGGLYLPEQWPHFSADAWRRMRSLSYAELGVEVMLPFVSPVISREELEGLVQRAWGDFAHKAVAPLKQLDANHFLLELFHGPTLAFKDYALQLVGELFAHVLEKRGETVTIVGATSGDTGSAAIEACRGRSPINIFILHPHGRVSEVQRRQMTTVLDDNVRNYAVDGNFDDCQDLVKAMFADEAFRNEVRLSAVNSINWARIMAQVVYYAWAALQLGAPDRPVAFSVPTGNFGNIFAGYVARKMGLPIERLVIGTNRNDILARFAESGVMEIKGVTPSLSPSMDIQVSSNFERLLFELLGRNGDAVSSWMTGFRKTGSAALDEAVMDEMRALFSASRCDDERTAEAIARIYAETGELLCPHSAIGVQAGVDDARFGTLPFVSLATAHAAKFPDAVKTATGVHPDLPLHLADLFERTERYERVANDLQAVEDQIRSVLRG